MNHEYNFDDFEALELRGRQLARSSEVATYERDDWDGSISDTAAKLIKSDPNAKRRFERDSEGLRDPSASAVDMSLASLLAHSEVAPADIEGALRASRQRAGVDSKHAGYFELTVSGIEQEKLDDKLD